MKILIIEDELDLLDAMKKYISSEGYICETAANYHSGAEKIYLYDYDCIVVDISLPDGNGFELIKALKKAQSKAGIIIVSAKNSLDDKLLGLELGSDDYLTKPFHLSELNARIKAIIRRKNFDGVNRLKLNEIEIDTAGRLVYVNDKKVVLTGKEYDLLLYFVSNKNKVVTKNSIAEHLWGDHIDQADSFDFIYTHIKNIRKKLMEKGCRDYINTIYGIGYNFDVLNN